MTQVQRMQVAVLLVLIHGVIGPVCISAILRPLRRRGWVRFEQIPDRALLAIYEQWGHLLR